MGIEIESEKRGIGVTREMWMIGGAKKRTVVRDDNAMKDRLIDANGNVSELCCVDAVLCGAAGL